MRILDTDHDVALREVCLYLTRAEAVELLGFLEQLLEQPALHHCHVYDESYAKEITVTIYDDTNLEGFDERSRKLILEDK